MSNKKLIFHFLEGKATSIQRKNIELWLEDPDNQEEFYMYLDEYEAEHPQYTLNVEEKLQEVKRRLNSDITAEEEPAGYNIDFNRSRIRWVAAVILTVLIALAYFKFTGNPVNKEMVEKLNGTSFPLTVTLPDRSSVILQPGAKIMFLEENFKSGKREVFFEGNGFFEVLKDSASSFVVHTDDFSTRVLGTSFTLKTAGDNSYNEVIVKTGKVEVFNEKERNITAAKSTILLSANQKIRFDKEGKGVLTPSVTSKEDLKEPIEQLSFEFEERPVTEVFDILASSYHVKIHYNEELLKKCSITAYLSDEPLYEKLRLICFALDAEFKVKDNTITILTKGC